MPKVGIEPTIPKEHDFESCASASSATSARPAQYNTAPYQVKMKLGIIGSPQSGKTTIFNALTRGNTPTTASAGRMEVHTAVVDVPDARVDRLSAMFKPKKTIYAKVTYADIAGLEGGGKASISGQLLNQLTQMDGFLLVVRAFANDNVPHPAGSVDPKRDLDVDVQRTAAQRPDRRGTQAGASDRGAQEGRHRQDHQRAADGPVHPAE